MQNQNSKFKTQKDSHEHGSIVVPEITSRQRLDIFLSEHGWGARSQIQRMIDEGRVVVNGDVFFKASYRVKTGDQIEIRGAHESSSVISVAEVTESTEIFRRIRVIHEDAEYLVVEKPAGLLVHPTEAHESVTLSSWLVLQYPEIITVGESDMRPGIVHRLDKEASGLLVIARTQQMFEHLKQQFKERTVEKVYTVLVYGSVPTEHGVIDFIIDRGREGRMVARPNTEMTLRNITEDRSGKEALTEFDVLTRLVRYTLLSVKIHTGRMHQIRVHMYAYNHPVVGDTLYAQKGYLKKNDKVLGRLFLHASKLCFETLQGERVSYECALPHELQEFLDTLT